MKSENLDDIDRRILAGLQRDARQPIAELAAAAGLSPSACHRRIKLLEERGVIASYGATLDREALGYLSGQADYLLRIAARDAQDYERIHRTRIARLPGVSRIISSLALRTVKSWSGYPVL
jgi:DNA-binding Lrp family transcriptional regulator